MRVAVFSGPPQRRASGDSGGCAAAAAVGAPVAVFVVGPPGAGKSSRLDAVLAGLPAAARDAVGGCVVDPDKLYWCHGGFAAAAAEQAQHERLVEWFLKGSKFEEAVFRADCGLMQPALRERRSFVQEATASTAGFAEWARFVAGFGYTVHLAVVHVPVDLAVARAEQRWAASRSTWTPPEFVRGCAAGLAKHVSDTWQQVRKRGGTATVFDNSSEACLPVLGDGAAPALSSPLPARAAADLGLEDELLSETRVQALAEALLEPTGLLGRHAKPAPRFAIAGGAFRRLLLGSVRPPRDIDLWPRSAEDAEALKSALLAAGAKPREERAWSSAFLMPSGVEVEVARRSHEGGVAEAVAGFDIALSAVGCDVEGGAVTRVLVHEQARESVRLREPLLLLGPGAPGEEAMPNERFLLATAERVVRYARSHGWPRPQRQLDFLLARFRRAASARETRDDFVEMYKTTTVDADARAVVCELFDVQI